MCLFSIMVLSPSNPCKMGDSLHFEKRKFTENPNYQVHPHTTYLNSTPYTTHLQPTKNTKKLYHNYPKKYHYKNLRIFFGEYLNNTYPKPKIIPIQTQP